MIWLDAERLSYEMGRRGLSAERLSELSGIAEATISRARHGHSIRSATLRELARGLLTQPIDDRCDLLIAKPPS